MFNHMVEVYVIETGGFEGRFVELASEHIHIEYALRDSGCSRADLHALRLPAVAFKEPEEGSASTSDVQSSSS
jgi:hypothetical protein